MGNIVIRKSSSGQPPSFSPSPWEPMRFMRDLLHWDPFRELAPSWRAEERARFMPAFEVKEQNDAYVFKADLPGVKQSDLEITLTGNRLAISGKREAEREEKGETTYTYECSYGDFMRAFTLPEGIDAEGVKAELKDGVLTVRVPKLPEVQPKQISVKAGGEGGVKA